jgi:hypothetical protein
LRLPTFAAYAILGVPAAALAVALFAVNRDSGPRCACAPEPRVCAEVTPSPHPSIPARISVTYPPLPTVEAGTATATPPPSPAPPPSQTSTITPTWTPPDPRLPPTPTPPRPVPTPAPDGLPLTVDDLRVDGGGCYVAFVGACVWQEIERRGKPGEAGFLVFLSNGCNASLRARYEPATNKLETFVVD